MTTTELVEKNLCASYYVNSKPSKFTCWKFLLQSLRSRSIQSWNEDQVMENGSTDTLHVVLNMCSYKKKKPSSKRNFTIEFVWNILLRNGYIPSLTLWLVADGGSVRLHDAWLVADGATVQRGLVWLETNISEFSLTKVKVGFEAEMIISCFQNRVGTR